jgi:hypothetical protein
MGPEIRWGWLSWEKVSAETREKKRDKHSCSRGGCRIDSHGYIKGLMPAHHRAGYGVYVLQHTVVYEEYHKCCRQRYISSNKPLIPSTHLYEAISNH